MSDTTPGVAIETVKAPRLGTIVANRVEYVDLDTAVPVHIKNPEGATFVVHIRISPVTVATTTTEVQFAF